MPRITLQDYMTPGAKPWWDYIQDAGSQLGKGISENTAQELEQKNKERAFAIEEDHAKARLLEESNRATALKERERERAADRGAAVQGLKDIAAEKEQDAVKRGLDQAMASPGGALGPFGVFTQTAKGISGEVMKVQAEMGPKIAMAQDMSPAGARQFLTKEAAAAKQQVIAAGYQEESKAVLKGVKDGVLTPKMAQDMMKTVRTGLRARVPPGQVHAQVAQAYDLHAKKLKRVAGWEDSDRHAGEVIAMLSKMAETAKVPSTQAALREKVAQAQGQWALTNPQSFREENDGEASVAQLEQILFNAQAVNKEIPHPPQYQPNFQLAPAEMAKANEIQAATAQNRTVTKRTAKAASQASQAAPGDGQAAEAPPPQRKTPARAGEAGGGRGKALSGDTDEAQLRGFVRDHAKQALESGGDPVAKIRKLRDDIADELGLNPRDPEVKAILADELKRLTEPVKR